MAQRRNKALEVLERRKKVAARYLRGQTQWEIAQAFEVNQATISRDLEAIQAEWLEQAVFDRGQITARELARIDEVERQAWAAWTKSQENAETVRARRRGDQAETEKVSKGQAGDPRFLDLILRCIQRRCDLLRLNEPSEPDDDDGDDAKKGAGSLGELAARVRAAVERCRARTGGAGGGPAGEAPPLEPPAGSADPGPEEPR